MESQQKLANELHLYSPHTSLHEAMAMTPSEARWVFESPEFKAYRDAQQATNKNIVEVSNRLNVVVQCLNNLAGRRW